MAALRLSTRRLANPSPLRCIHPRLQSTIAQHQTSIPPTSAPEPTVFRPLARLPTANICRALGIHMVTATPPLLALGSKLMLATADSVDRIPPLKWLIDKTFYAHFCAGSTAPQITATIDTLRDLGYSGIILVYAREVDPSTTTSAASEISQWLSGTLKTIAMTTPGDFVAIKLTGAGSACNTLLSQYLPCTEVPELADALDQICAAAKERKVGLLVDAEQAALQAGVDKWTLQYMRRYNTGDSESAVVFNTYQMYLRRSEATVREHHAMAQREGWKLGVKLVRGAYLHTDPRELIHATKEDTDKAYNSAAAYLIKAGVDTIIASHNRESVMEALKLKQETKTPGILVAAQLMGMADELSLSLVQEGAKVLKYTVWGTTGECLKYLLRRAEENKDAVGRSVETYEANLGELKRRVFNK